MRQIMLHDTRRGEPVELVPRDPGKVGIYACGPTVYNRIHVGNARPYVVFSLLKRFLVHEGYSVAFVANVTDVNDKIYDAAVAQGVPSSDLAREMTGFYESDTNGLELGRPDFEPKATETIDGIVDLISALISSEHAYAVEGDVYFRVRSDPSYGSLSGRDVDDELDQGEGLEGASLKEDPLDFALWKAQKEGEDTAWDAPWGRGRPGWHIECSAMAEQLLGVDFDIHGGGIDLAFPHHENEAAQTRAGRGTELARIWMHNGMLQMGGKMSKSLGNVVGLPDALSTWGRDAIVMLFCGGHYRQPLQYDESTLGAADAAVRRVREAARKLVDGPSPPELAPLREQFFDALARDFNTPGALAVLFDWVREANRRADLEVPVGRDDLVEMLQVLGLEGLALPVASEAPAAVVALAQERAAARAAKDFAESDRLRDAIASHGWVVRDVAGGYELVPA